MSSKKQVNSFTEQEISSLNAEIEELNKHADLIKSRIDILEDKRSFLMTLRTIYNPDEKNYNEFAEFVSKKGMTIQNHINGILRDNKDKPLSVRDIAIRLGWKGVPIAPEKRPYLYTILSRMNEKGYVVKTSDNKWKASDKEPQEKVQEEAVKIFETALKSKTEKPDKSKRTLGITESVTSLFRNNPEKEYDFRAVCDHLRKTGIDAKPGSVRHALKLMFLQKKILKRVSRGSYKLKR